MRIKIIIHDGIVTSVLSDGEAEVEVIDIDQDYDDSELLLAYEKQIRQDESLHEIDYVTANFEQAAEDAGGKSEEKDAREEV